MQIEKDNSIGFMELSICVEKCSLCNHQHKKLQISLMGFIYDKWLGM